MQIFEVLTTLDYILFVFALVFAIWGAIKGFISEITSKGGYVTGFLLAVMFSGPLASLIQTTSGFVKWLCVFISYVALFIAGFYLMHAVGTALKGVTDATKLNALDALLGFFLALAEILLVFAVFVKLLGNQSLIDVKDIFENSLFVSEIISPVGEFVLGFLHV